MGAPTLRGRRGECEALERVLDAARAGNSAIVVLRGEAGSGKTALLDFLLERASNFHIARVLGVESEMELAFAGLHQLCAPMLDRVEHLPAPQRDALRVAFGLAEGDAPDRFLLGLAVLTLLADQADAHPLVCIIDDAQWLDRASMQVLAFVARRAVADRLALVFSVREPSEERELAGLPELAISPLADSDARLVLGAAIRGLLDDRVRDRIIVEARGNPLALVQLPLGLTAAELAGGFGLPSASAVASRIEHSFGRQVQALPDDTRRLLLTAAAEPTGDVTLLWRALDKQGIDAGAASPAQVAGLLELGARVRFRHPLGAVVAAGDRFEALWTDATGAALVELLPTRAQAVHHVARYGAGGLRFHDLRHSYATWRVDDAGPRHPAHRQQRPHPPRAQRPEPRGRRPGRRGSGSRSGVSGCSARSPGQAERPGRKL
jgi:hypothetical protein